MSILAAQQITVTGNIFVNSTQTQFQTFSLKKRIYDMVRSCFHGSNPCCMGLTVNLGTNESPRTWEDAAYC